MFFGFLRINGDRWTPVVGRESGAGLRPPVGQG